MLPKAELYELVRDLKHRLEDGDVIKYKYDRTVTRRAGDGIPYDGDCQEVETLVIRWRGPKSVI